MSAILAKPMIDLNAQLKRLETALRIQLGKLTNQLPISTDAEGEIYNGKGYKEHTALSAETGADYDRTGSAEADVAATGYIPIPAVTGGDLGQVIIRVANADMTMTACTRMCFYDESKGFLGIAYGDNMTTSAASAVSYTKVLATLDVDSHIVSIDPSVLCQFYKTSKDKTARYIRLAGFGIDDSTIITVNEVIE